MGIISCPGGITEHNIFIRNSVLCCLPQFSKHLISLVRVASGPHLVGVTVPMPPDTSCRGAELCSLYYRPASLRPAGVVVTFIFRSRFREKPSRLRSEC